MNIDELITRYSIQDNYSAGAGSIMAATAAMGAAFYAARQALSSLERVTVGFIRSAIEEAAKIERLQYTFGALSRSMDVAAQKMDYLRKFALESVLEFDDLAQAATILEAGGLRMERFLPTLSNVVAAFGGGKDQVMEFAEALARIPSGMFGESERILRRFGINASDFIAEGLQVSKGRINATAEQVLQAVVNIAQRKFGSIGEMLQDTISVRFSNLQDAWNQLLTSFGMAFEPLIKQVTNILNPLIQFLTQGGMAAHAGGGIAGIFQQMIGDGQQLIRIFFFLAVFIDTLPRRFNFVVKWLHDLVEGFLQLHQEIYYLTAEIQNRIANAFKESLHSIFGPAIAEFKILAGMWDKVGSFKDWLGNKKGPAGGETYHREARNMQEWLDNLTKPNTQMDTYQSPFKNPFTLGQGETGTEWLRNQVFTKQDQARVNDLMKQFGLFQQQGPQKTPDASQYNMWNGLVNPMTETAKNTGAMAKTMLNWDAKRVALGGGELGRMGVTPLEIFQGRRPRGAGPANFNINLQGNSLDEMIKNAISDALRAHRYGLEVGVH